MRKEQIHTILLPRTEKQKSDLLRYLDAYPSRDLTVPRQAFRGPELIQSADIVISGGGTMNREAACLGVPVYSIYAGPLGAVDRSLIDAGKLVLLRDENDLSRIHFAKRKAARRRRGRMIRDRLIDDIVGKLFAAAQMKRAGRK